MHSVNIRFCCKSKKEHQNDTDKRIVVPVDSSDYLINGLEPNHASLLPTYWQENMNVNVHEAELNDWRPPTHTSKKKCYYWDTERTRSKEGGHFCQRGYHEIFHYVFSRMKKPGNELFESRADAHSNECSQHPGPILRTHTWSCSISWLKGDFFFKWIIVCRIVLIPSSCINPLSKTNMISSYSFDTNMLIRICYIPGHTLRPEDIKIRRPCASVQGLQQQGTTDQVA